MKKHIFQLIDGIEYVIENPETSLEELFEKLSKEGSIILKVKNKRIAFRTNAVIMVIEEDSI